MCCLFGFYNYSGKDITKLSVLTNSLAKQAIIRGKDASGIAYNDNGKLVIHKEGKSADKIDFKHSDDIVCVTGHTRHSTQGSHKKNHNNHPFRGECKNLDFALSHNGVLMNDHTLQREYKFPKTKVETDSYVAVQLLEMKKHLNVKNIKFMAEKIEGSFAFTIIDSADTLWLIRGDSPLSLIHFPKYKLYVYASTDEILYKALVDTKLFEEIKKCDFEEIQVDTGDILHILKDGTIVCNKFKYKDYSFFGRSHHWWDYGYESEIFDSSYIDELKSIAPYQGFAAEDIDELIESGFSPEEIEEYIYCIG